MNYTSVNDIISKCFSDLKDATDENYKRYYQWILRGYGQLRIHKLPLDIAVPLPVQTTGVRCVILPKDYVSFTSIGKNINNQLHKFSLKADLTPLTTEECGIETQAASVDGEQRVGYATGGGRNLWYYRLDEENNRILIYGAPLTTATLVYKSTGVSANGEVFIPTIAEEALIAWVHFQQALGDGDKGMIGIRQQIFSSAITDLQMSEWNSDVMFDAIRSTIYQGVKR
jgi:hypothetical protein